MKEYKRLTERAGKGICIKETSTNDNKSIWNAIERLAELEDKIENGTLIEFPRIDRYVDFCYGLEKFVVQWVVNGKVKSKMFWDEKKAKAKLKELQEQDNDR